MTLLTATSAKHHTTSLKSSPPTPFPVVIGRTTRRVLLSSADQFKMSQNKLKFPWAENVNNETESR